MVHSKESPAQKSGERNAVHLVLDYLRQLGSSCAAYIFNVLKPVPEPPSGTRTRPVEGLWNRKMDAVLIGGPGHVDAKH